MAKKVKIHKRIKINKKLYTVFFPSISAVIFLALLIFMFWHGGSMVPQHEIYISSENPKQGDTVLIRVNSKYPAVSGSFENKDIIFYKNGKYSDWVTLLGIDAGIKPGKYKISVNAFGEKMEKEINIEIKGFPVIKMPVTKEMQDKGYTGEKIVQNIKNNDNPNLNEVLDKFTPQAYFNSPFTFPLQKIQNSGLVFGELIKSTDYQIQHFGTDLRAGSGTKVYAINDGKVVLEKELSNYGKTVIIDHGLGIFSLYLHLDEFLVSANQNVKKNQIIGLSGNTGYSTAPHLHFSIRDNGTRVDPILFIRTSEKTTENFNLASIKNALTKIFNIDVLK